MHNCYHHLRRRKPYPTQQHPFCFCRQVHQPFAFVASHCLKYTNRQVQLVGGPTKYCQSPILPFSIRVYTTTRALYSLLLGSSSQLGNSIHYDGSGTICGFLSLSLLSLHPSGMSVNVVYFHLYFWIRCKTIEMRSSYYYLLFYLY